MSRTADPDQPWTRLQLLVLLVSIVLVALVLMGAWLYGVAGALGRTPPDAQDDRTAVQDFEPERFPTAPEAPAQGTDYRDRIAAAPMLETIMEDFEPAEPALEPADQIHIAPASHIGVAEVPTGYTHTPEGAIGQLASIVTTTLSSMSLGSARTIHDSWSEPDADYLDWPIAHAIRDFHGAAGSVEGDETIVLGLEPIGAQVKGTDGPDWLVVCVHLDVRMRVDQEARIGFGHCERMAWHDDRWIIAAGDPPAPAPSTWPATERTIEAGWLAWVDGQE